MKSISAGLCLLLVLTTTSGARARSGGRAVTDRPLFASAQPAQTGSTAEPDSEVDDGAGSTLKITGGGLFSMGYGTTVIGTAFLAGIAHNIGGGRGVAKYLGYAACPFAGPFLLAAEMKSGGAFFWVAVGAGIAQLLGAGLFVVGLASGGGGHAQPASHQLAITPAIFPQGGLGVMANVHGW